MSEVAGGVWSIILAGSATDASCQTLHATLNRARRVSGLDRRVTIIGSGRRRFFEEMCEGRTGQVIEEPRDCGTCAGVFLSATYVLAQDPDATVLFLPSNHCAEPEERFVRYLRSACRMAACDDRLILLAARPRSAETRYRWVLPAVASDGQGAPANAIRLHETPAEAEAVHLYRRGALWNTMIVAAKVKAIWELGRLHHPDMMRRFEMLRDVLHAVRQARVPPAHEALGLSHCYRSIEYADFSRDLLARSVRSLSIQVLDGVEWTEPDGPRGIGRPTLAQDPMFRPVRAERRRTRTADLNPGRRSRTEASGT